MKKAQEDFISTSQIPSFFKNYNINDHMNDFVNNIKSNNEKDNLKLTPSPPSSSTNIIDPVLVWIIILYTIC